MNKSKECQISQIYQKSVRKVNKRVSDNEINQKSVSWVIWVKGVSSGSDK